MIRILFLSLKNISFTTLLIFMFFSCTHRKRPNIIIIMADDMGFSDIGSYGGEIPTPHLDRLANNGLRFSQFYNNARCCPSRASLMTGKYPHKAGIGKMVNPTEHYPGYLLPDAATLAEVLKEEGYSTWMTGKWHVGEDSLHWPLQRGFDHYYGLISGASSYYELDSGRTFLEDNHRVTPGKEFYATDAYSEKAVGYIRQARSSTDPFFLYVAYTAPHWPLHAPEHEVQKFLGQYRKGWDQLRDERFERLRATGMIDDRWTLSTRDSMVYDWERESDKDHWERRMAVYSAMISIMDSGIGKIIAALDEEDALDNTLIFFLADNGGSNEFPHVYHRKRKYMTEEELKGTPGNRTSYVGYEAKWAHASNTPFKLYKQYIHEGGIASPLIVHWPAQIADPGIRHEVTHIMDIMPTCLDAAGVALPLSAQPLDGISMLPVLKGQPWNGHSELIWEHFGNKGIRQGKYKLVSVKDGKWELYDMEKDRTETTNLADLYPGKVNELEALYKIKSVEAGVKE